MTSAARVVLVTGGSRGIGRACACALARTGHAIAFSYLRDRDAALRTAELAGAAGVEVRFYQADVGDADAARGLVSRAIEDFGRLDVLVVNAAIAPVVPIEEITPEEWDRVMAVNLRGAFVCAQAAFLQMRVQREGRILFISSQAGQAGGVFVGAHYVASKAALLGLTKSFAKAGAPHGILVNCVAPGQIDTPLTETFPPDRVADLTRAVPLGRMGTPEEVAEVIAFLAGSGASYVTGATVPVNGGLLMP